MITLREFAPGKGLKPFIKFPYGHYKDSPHWIPPLLADEWNTFNSAKNQAFKYCDARFWVAYRDEKPVGRIVAIRNNKANELWKQRYLRFGWIELTDDPEVSAALLGAVEDWAREQGLEAVHGPMGFTDMDEEGMLIDGFDEMGTLPMIYNYEYYPRHLEQNGYVKDVDWLQYDIEVPEKLDERFARIKEIVFAKFDLHLLEAKSSRDIRPYAPQVFDVLNACYSHLYGFVPLNEQQIADYTDQYFGFIQPDFCKIVLDSSDKVVGFFVAMPRLSQALRKARGRLFPFGFIHLLRALRRPKEVVFYLIGVRPDHQASGVNSILMSESYQSLIDRGVTRVLSCGELEDNKEINMLMGSFPNRINKRRRAWIKKL